MRATLEARYEAESNIVRATVNRGAFDVSAGIAVLFKHWGIPDPDLAKKYGSDSGGPGDHGIPEIGQLEANFYRTLTAGQKDAFADLKALVTELYERGMTWEGIDPFDVTTTVDEWKMRAIAELAAHPMQAFLLGQFLATEAASGKAMKPLSSEDKRTISFLEHYTFHEIDSSFDQLKGDIRRMLIEGMQQRKGPIAIARTLENTLNDHKTHWEMVAITETARAESQGRLQEFLDRGYNEVKTSAAHDSRVCEWCEKQSGQPVAIKDVIGLSNYGRKRDAWIVGVLPAHPRCRCVYLPVWVEKFAVPMLADLLKNITDAEGHVHDSATGQFTNSSSSSVAPMKAPASARLSATWKRDQVGPRFLTVKATNDDKRRYGWYSCTLDRNTKTFHISLLDDPYPQTADLSGAVFAKIVAEVKKLGLDVETFAFTPFKDHQTKDDGRKQAGAALMEATFKAYFTDGKPNDMFPATKSLAQKAKPSEIAEDQSFGKLSKEQREIVVKAVGRELQACSLMPKKLGMLTDKAVSGVKSGAHTLAWAMPQEQGGTIVRIVATQEKWDRVTNAPIDDSVTAPLVCVRLPSEKRADAIITHEMGHVLDFAIAAKIKAGDTKLAEAYAAFMAHRARPKTSAEFNSGEASPSAYARKNAAEYFAEIYCAYRFGIKVPKTAVTFFESIGLESIEKSEFDGFYRIEEVDGDAPTFECGIIDFGSEEIDEDK